MIVYPPSPSGRCCKRTVQWRHTNVQDGLVRTDPEMLNKLISTESLHKYYKLDPTPFAKGMFASVWRCKSIATGEVYAAKFSSRYRYGEDCTSEIYHEIALLSLCSPSPRIIKLHDVFQTQKELIIVMEYAPGGDMQTLIDDNLVPFEKDVVKYVQDVVEGLAYLHHRKIAHLDIKPQNLVMMGEFPDCDVKVCDFEISRVVLDGTEVHEILGTPEYVPPEILHYEPITLAADMWSLGVTTYVLLTGFSPFGGETDQETFLNISRAQVDFPDELFEDVSEDAKDFVRRLLLRNPRERMSSKQALKHPWLVKARKARQAGSKARVESRIGCATCPSNNTNLRSYLSKSREALFEKVMSQGDLRKKTLIQQYNRTRRMCESQMSLCAREKYLRKESAMSRSREKLYGLKSMSKSQEVLSFYKSVLNLNDDVFKMNKDKEIVAETDEESLPGPLEDPVTGDADQGASLVPEIGAARPDSEATNPPQSPTSTEAATTSESEISEEEDSVKESESGEIRSRCWESPEPAEPKKPNAEGDEEEEPKFTVAQLVSAYNKHQEVITKSSLEVTMRTQRCWESPEPAEPKKPNAEGDEEEEPKFTVAQLVSAYNKHQEVITKSSLEVTMRTQRFENITGEVFPTGPNALRLFIPDIKIRKSKPKQKKRMPRKKTGLPSKPLDLSEDLENVKIEDEPRAAVPVDTVEAVEERLQPKTKSDEDVPDKLSESLSDRLGVTAPPPKYMRAETSPEPKDKRQKPPYYMSSYELKTTPMSNVAKTVELFNNFRPDRKSFSTPRSPPNTPAPEKTRRKSSPPTMKPF